MSQKIKMQGIDTNALSDTVKKDLMMKAFGILSNLPMESIKGNKSLAQELVNRIESVSKTADQFKFLVNAVTVLLQRSKDSEMQIIYKGDEISRTKLLENHGIIVAPTESLLEQKLKLEFNKKAGIRQVTSKIKPS